MNIHRPVQRMGSFADIWGLSSLFQPRGGQTTVIPGAPTPVSAAVIAAILAGVVGVAILHKKRMV